MMRGVATLCIEQYGEYQLSAINDREELIKYRNILSDSKPNLKSPQKTSNWLGRNPFLKKPAAKNFVPRCGVQIEVTHISSLKNMTIPNILNITIRNSCLVKMLRIWRLFFFFGHCPFITVVLL